MGGIAYLSDEQGTIMKKKSTFEFYVLFIVFAFVAAGTVMAFVDKDFFENAYVVEDGIIESLTCFGLLYGSGICFKRAFRLRAKKPFIFVAATVMLGLVLFFGAGEEISWGQRIFNIESSDLFLQHNAQAEMNIHNLTVSGVKLNKLIFSNMLGIIAGFYILVLPFIYRKKERIRELVDSFAIPLPSPYQVVSILVMMVLVMIAPSSKNPELLEFGGSYLYLLVLKAPFNDSIFRS